MNIIQVNSQKFDLNYDEANWLKIPIKKMSRRRSTTCMYQGLSTSQSEFLNRVIDLSHKHARIENTRGNNNTREQFCVPGDVFWNINIMTYVLMYGDRILYEFSDKGDIISREREGNLSLFTSLCLSSNLICLGHWRDWWHQFSYA